MRKIDIMYLIYNCVIYGNRLQIDKTAQSKYTKVDTFCTLYHKLQITNIITCQYMNLWNRFCLAIMQNAQIDPNLHNNYII